jgi:hypothetical protein
MTEDFLSALANEEGSAIDLLIRQKDGTQASIALPINELGLLVIGLLSGAATCAVRSGKTAHIEDDPAAGGGLGKYVTAHEVGLTEADDPDLITIVFAIGVIEMGIGISRELLAPLGNAFQALSAGGQRH